MVTPIGRRRASVPLISRITLGLVVPIPTLPLESILIRSAALLTISFAVNVIFKGVLRLATAPRWAAVTAIVSPTSYPLPAVVTITLVIKFVEATIFNIAPDPLPLVVLADKSGYVPAVISSVKLLDTLVNRSWGCEVVPIVSAPTIVPIFAVKN